MVGRYKIHQEFCSYNSTSLQNLISIQNYEQKQNKGGTLMDTLCLVKERLFKSW